MEAATACTEKFTCTSDVPAPMPFCPPDDMPDCPPDNVESVQSPLLAAPTAESTSLSMSSVTPEPPVAATIAFTPATAPEKVQSMFGEIKEMQHSEERETLVEPKGRRIEANHPRASKCEFIQSVVCSL